MFFRKKADPGFERADDDSDARATTGEFEIALSRLDETIEQKKGIAVSAKKLTKRLADSIPDAPRKRRTA